jgi:hypothetical protein
MLQKSISNFLKKNSEMENYRKEIEVRKKSQM